MSLSEPDSALYTGNWQYEAPDANPASGPAELHIEGHRLTHIQGCKRACAYCQMLSVKTKSGWAKKTYYKCETCDVPLCRGLYKECYRRYHELRKEHDNMSPKMMQKAVKASIKQSFKLLDDQCRDSQFQ